MRTGRNSLISIKAAAIVGAGLLMLAILAWISTGREGYTRWPNAKLEQADVAGTAEESDLLADIGFEDSGEQVPIPEFESRFAFGLLPGGFDPQHLLSVASIAAISMGMIVFAAVFHASSGMILTRTRERKAHD